VAVEKLLPAKFAKIKLRQDAPQSIYSGRLYIFYTPNFGCLGRKVSFSTATGFVTNRQPASLRIGLGRWPGMHRYEQLPNTSSEFSGSGNFDLCRTVASVTEGFSISCRSVGFGRSPRCSQFQKTRVVVSARHSPRSLLAFCFRSALSRFWNPVLIPHRAEKVPVEIRTWLLKNSLFVPNSQNLGYRKCIGDPSKSIVGHPDAILFLRILRGGVFQQPQDNFTQNRSMSEMGTLRQLSGAPVYNRTKLD
jgi:hypothetical protein